MVLLPEPENTTKHLIESKTTESEGRPYLGMSSIGKECMRALWLTFHWCSKNKIDARVKRIFERGDLEEARIIKDLKSIGAEVYRPGLDGEPERVELFGIPGEYQEEVIGFAGHAKGHTDGRVIGIPESTREHLLEIKTMGDKYFKQLVKNKVKKSFPVYYSQMQRYMKATGLRRALFIATNKNDEDRHYERVKYDKNHAEMLVEKERNIILMPLAPKKDYKPTWYLCRFCQHRYVCHHGETPVKSCRSCAHCDLDNDGVWSCSLQDDKELTVEEQRAACDKYELSIFQS